MNESNINQDILTEYEKTLVIPKEKPAHQFILCPVGLVGAGKTTVMEPLCERLSLVRISSDELRKMLKEHGLGYENVFDTAVALVLEYIEKGYSIGIDADCASDHTQELIEQVEKEKGIKAVWIHVNPPEEFILNKLRTFSLNKPHTFEYTWLFKNAEEAVKNYVARKPVHEKLGMPFVYTFDTSKATLSEQVEKALMIIKAVSGN